MNRIYLDYNASTPVHPDVIQEISTFFRSYIGNPSSTHSFGREVNATLLRSREFISKYLKTKPRQLLFTSGATEAMNMLIRGFISKNPGSHIISSDLEHSCVYNTLKLCASKGLCTVTFIKGDSFGAVKPEKVQKALTPQTKLIVLMAANNETGVKTDYEKIADIALTSKCHFILDGVALLGKEFITIPEGVSAMTFSGHKCYAPKGVGCVFIHPYFKIDPLITGGGQEFQKRAGTENMSGIIGFAKALTLIEKEMPETTPRMEILRNKFEAELTSNLQGVHINGKGPRIVNTSNLSFDGVDGETLLTMLDMEGVAASHGSACTSGALEPSRVLQNMGLSNERVRSAVRFSIGYMTTEVEIDRAVDIVISCIRKLR